LALYGAVLGTAACSFFALILCSSLTSRPGGGEQWSRTDGVFGVYYTILLSIGVCVYVHSKSNAYTAAVQGVRITPKGNIELGFPDIRSSYILYYKNRAEWKIKWARVFSAVSLLHDTLYITAYMYIYTYSRRLRSTCDLIHIYASNIRFSRKRLYFFLFTGLYAYALV